MICHAFMILLQGDMISFPRLTEALLIDWLDLIEKFLLLLPACYGWL